MPPIIDEVIGGGGGSGNTEVLFETCDYVRRVQFTKTVFDAAFASKVTRPTPTITTAVMTAGGALKITGPTLTSASRGWANSDQIRIPISTIFADFDSTKHNVRILCRRVNWTGSSNYGLPLGVWDEGSSAQTAYLAYISGPANPFIGTLGSTTQIGSDGIGGLSATNADCLVDVKCVTNSPIVMGAATTTALSGRFRFGQGRDTLVNTTMNSADLSFVLSAACISGSGAPGPTDIDIDEVYFELHLKPSETLPA
ncbi:MAG: hypothetical protein AAGA48_41215 [Myxococcota bacterium]